MEGRIEIEVRGKKPSEVVELLLDNCTASKISGLTDEFTNLATLSFINVGLTTLEGLPYLKSLRTIDLSDNKLTGDLDILVKQCPRLYHVNLCANRIKDIATLEPLKKLSELNALDLFDCEVTELPDYRKKMFEMIPQLKYLDGFDVNDVEAEMSDDDDAEDAMPEDADISDEDDAEETGEENGLAYLNSSKALQDEDESEDFHDNVPKNGAENGNNGSDLRGKKRKHGEEDGGEEKHSNDEPAAKATA